jgi:hypothetical protein
VFSVPCAAVLHRIRVPGALIAYIPCSDPACPLAWIRGDRVINTRIPALGGARITEIHDVPVLLVLSRWMKSPDVTGGDLIVLQVEPTLRRLGSVPLDEVDATSPQVVFNRLGTWTQVSDGIRFVGEARRVERDTGKPLTTSPIDEVYRVTPDGRLIMSKGP